MNPYSSYLKELQYVLNHQYNERICFSSLLEINIHYISTTKFVFVLIALSIVSAHLELREIRKYQMINVNIYKQIDLCILFLFCMVIFLTPNQNYNIAPNLHE